MKLPSLLFVLMFTVPQSDPPDLSTEILEALPLVVVPPFVSDPDSLDLQFRPLGYGRADGRYPKGKPISLQMRVENVGGEPMTILLKDHDRNGYQEPFPEGLRVRLLDKEDRILTKHTIVVPGKDSSEWWSSAYLISESCSVGVDCEMPGDRVDLAPGEVVYRVFRLDLLLAGAPEIKRGLAPGTYSVELSFFGIESKPVTIVIEPAHEEDE